MFHLYLQSRNSIKVMKSLRPKLLIDTFFHVITYYFDQRNSWRQIFSANWRLFCPPKGFLVTKMFLKQTFFFLNSSNHIDFEVLNLNLDLNCYKYNPIRMLLSISKVYLSYKSDKKLLAAIASRQKGQKYLQFAQ